MHYYVKDTREKNPWLLKVLKEMWFICILMYYSKLSLFTTNMHTCVSVHMYVSFILSFYVYFIVHLSITHVCVYPYIITKTSWVNRVKILSNHQVCGADLNLTTAAVNHFISLETNLKCHIFSDKPIKPQVPEKVI